MFAQDPTPATTGATATGAAGGGKPDDIKGAVNSPDFLFWSVVLAVILFVSAGVFYIVDRWRKGRPDADADREASLSLSSFREMYEEGEITESEYRRLRDKTAAKMKDKPGVPPAGPKPKPPPPPLHPNPIENPPDPAS